jgi:hypothetical protein
VLFSKLSSETAHLKDLEGDSILPINNAGKSEGGRDRIDTLVFNGYADGQVLATRLMEEVLLLISLTYMAIGKNHEPPAV